MQQVIEDVPLSAENRCSVPISCIAKLLSVTHLPTSWCKCCSHHNNTCVCTIHRFLCSASQRQTDSKSHWKTPPPVWRHNNTVHAVYERGSRCFCLLLFKIGLTLPNLIPLSSQSRSHIMTPAHEISCFRLYSSFCCWSAGVQWIFQLLLQNQLPTVDRDNAVCELKEAKMLLRADRNCRIGWSMWQHRKLMHFFLI